MSINDRRLLNRMIINDGRLLMFRDHQWLETIDIVRSSIVGIIKNTGRKHEQEN